LKTAGRASKSKPTESINLADDEAFEELTAALYDPKNDWILVQFNSVGPRAREVAPEI
jgi:hypothetical protein